VTDYARVVLTPLLRLAAGAGIGIEAHLQNCVVTFIDGLPHRLVLRDFAGLRLYPPRLGRPVELWPGSVVVTDDLDTMRAKVAYTAIQAHLGELVLQLAQAYGLDEADAWGRIRTVIAEIYDDLAGATEMGATDISARAAADHAFLTAATVPHKALLTMRLAARRGSGGDLYVPVRNPLR
jgi:siderophore synthetase component